MLPPSIQPTFQGPDLHRIVHTRRHEAVHICRVKVLQRPKQGQHIPRPTEGRPSRLTLVCHSGITHNAEDLVAVAALAIKDGDTNSGRHIPETQRLVLWGRRNIFSRPSINTLEHK